LAPFLTMISNNLEEEPSIETAIAIHAEASKILHGALDREYLRRRQNLVNAGLGNRHNSLLPNLQNDVRDIACLGTFAGEHKRTIHACFATWTPPKFVPVSRIPQNY
jgi:hypothetical protein